MAKKVIEYTKEFYASDFDCVPISEAITILEDLKEKYGDATLDYDYEGKFYVVIRREETDAEYAERLEREALEIKQVEEREMTQLKRLLQKYPDMAK